MSYSFDRQFQQRLELIFKKAEFDRMQEYRRQQAQKQDNTSEQQPKNDNGTACTKKGPAPKPR